MISLVRRNRDYRIVYLAGAISLLGDWFATVALLGLALELTHSVLVVALIFVAQEVPTILFGTVAGAIADRYDRRRISVVCISLQALAAGSFLLAGPGTVWIIVAGQFAITTLACFTGPALSAAIPQLVDAPDLSTAVAASSSTWGIMVVVGSAIGGLVILAFGRSAVFVVNALTFAAAAALIAGVRRPMQGSDASQRARVSVRSWTVLREVLGYVRRTPAMPALVVSRLGFGVAIGMVGLLAPLAAAQSSSADTGVAILLAARGAGAAIGPVVGRRALRRGGGAALLACGLGCIVMGMSYWCVVLSPALWVTALAVAVAHLGSSTQFNVATYAVLMRTPDEMRGRVASVNDAILTVITTLSFLGAGLLGGLLGTRWTVAIFATWVFVWGCGYLVATRALRRDASWTVFAAPLPSVESQVI